MGTENVMLAATLARGTTVIDNAAREPEVDDLVAMLCSMGARIERTAERRIEIDGVERLSGTEHVVIGDRLEAETFAIAAAITRGDVAQRHRPGTSAPSSRYATRSGSPTKPMPPLPACACSAAADGLRAVDVRTDPYPGFATDFQAPLSVLLTQADGVSTIHETIFEDRMDHTGEL